MTAAANVLSPVSLRFADPRMEARYRALNDGRCVQVLRIACVAGIALVMTMGILVQYVGSRELVHGADRPGVILGGSFLMLVAIAATYIPLFARHPQAFVAILGALTGAAVVVGLREMPAEFATNRGYMLIVLHTFTIHSLLRLRMPYAVAAGWACLALYVGLMFAWNVVDFTAIARQSFWLGAANVWGMWIGYQLELGARREFAASTALDRERARTEELLLNILPAPIAARLKESHEAIAEHRGAVTVLFADIVGFTPLSARRTPADLVKLLDDVFTHFDALAREHGLEKIKTIGDAYMAVAGLPEEQPDHALRAARMAVAMVEAMRGMASRHGEAIQLRVGIHSGPVVAGVIGRSKFSYDLWGDTVNTASRMESMGVPDCVQCSPATAAFLGAEFALQSRGNIEVKGKGAMETFLVSLPAAEEVAHEAQQPESQARPARSASDAPALEEE
jgi:class 3 adenylate cyclase